MNWLSLALVAVLLASADDLRAQPSPAAPKPGDTYELTLTRDMAQRDSLGGSGRSHDRDILIERVVEVRPDGLVLEYDLPQEAPAELRASEWRLPARVLKPALGPIRLLNHAELEARVDGWLKGGGRTRADCGRPIFTWNAFLIDCDPQSVIAMVRKFELPSSEIREGASYLDPDARGPASLTRAPSGPALVADMAIDPDTIRRARAEADVGVAQLMNTSLTFEDALRARAKDTVSGTISVMFETSPAGEVQRRTTVKRLEIGRPDHPVETRATTETLERRLVPPSNF